MPKTMSDLGCDQTDSSKLRPLFAFWLCLSLILYFSYLTFSSASVFLLRNHVTFTVYCVTHMRRHYSIDVRLDSTQTFYIHTCTCVNNTTPVWFVSYETKPGPIFLPSNIFDSQSKKIMEKWLSLFLFVPSKILLSIVYQKELLLSIFSIRVCIYTHIAHMDFCIHSYMHYAPRACVSVYVHMYKFIFINISYLLYRYTVIIHRDESVWPEILNYTVL